MDLNVNLNEAGFQPADDLPPHPAFKETSYGEWEFHIDNSTLERFMACPQSAENYILKRRDAPPSSALVFGGAIHDAMEVYYKNPFDPTIHQQAREAFIESYNERPPARPDWRTADHGLLVLDRYFKHYEQDELAHNILVHNDEPLVERSFTIELGTIEVNADIPGYTRGDLLGSDCENPDAPARIRTLHVFYTGKVDLANVKSGQLWVTDHKTTTVLGDNFWAQFEMSSQTIGYCWAFKQITGQIPVGAQINCWALRKPTPTGKPVRFERQSFFYRPDKIDEWEHDTMCLVADFTSHAVRGYFPHARLWCLNKYGKCKYFEVCAAPKSSRANVLATSQFSNVTWDPTA